jgi:hypothetical protein
MFLNLAQHALRVVYYLLIRETKNTKPRAKHVRIARTVVMPGLILFMNLAITFNNEARFATKEVGDVIADLMLPAKLETAQSTSAKQLP